MSDSNKCLVRKRRLILIDNVGYVPVSNCHHDNCPFDDWEIDEEINYDEEVEEVEKQPLAFGFIQKQEIVLLDSLLEGIEKLEKATTKVQEKAKV